MEVQDVLLRSLLKAGFSSLSTLPAEIRVMLLQAIARQKHRGWASLAPVCKEWQYYIEKENFFKLKLQVDCLDEFQRLIVRRRELIHYIQFEVKLREYNCRRCNHHDGDILAESNGSILSGAIEKLFSVLSKFKPAGDLALELNVYSPSDSEHWSKDSIFASDNEDHAQVDEPSTDYHEPRHGWINGHRTIQHTGNQRTVNFGQWSNAYARVAGYPLMTLKFSETLPYVNAVTRFISPRSTRRTIHPTDLALVLQKLCRLEYMTYESWRQCVQTDGTWFYQRLYVTNLEDLFLKQLPATLKRLSLFKDSNDLSRVLAAAHPHTAVPGSNVTDPSLGMSFAFRSLDLEEVSISYMVDGGDFIRACTESTAWTWPRLRSLYLTSQLMEPTGTDVLQLHGLLYQAGSTALRMPNLHTFALWNGAEGNACAFVYQSDRRGASITWRGTWELEMHAHVVDVWRRVAAEQRHRLLSVVQQKTAGGADAVRNHGDGIYLTDLPCEVVTPKSLWQIRRERALWKMHMPIPGVPPPSPPRAPCSGPNVTARSRARPNVTTRSRATLGRGLT